MADPHLLQLMAIQCEVDTCLQLEGLALLQILKRKRDAARRATPRRFWVRNWITKRGELGFADNLMIALEKEDPRTFQRMCGVPPEMFREILGRIQRRITKQTTRFRKPHPPFLKLGITLSYFASGITYYRLEMEFLVPENSISVIVKEVTDAIIMEYADEVLKIPKTPEEWKQVAEVFASRWNFLHCCGAIDGKHIAIIQPNLSTALYHNYKGFFSLILLAVVDGDYKFLWVDAGTPGSTCDASVFDDSTLKAACEDGRINFPAAEPLPNDIKDMPYFFVGDDAFSLREWMMKPHSRQGMSHHERIFNYRLSRARRIVENAFGILVNRFRCFTTTMAAQPEQVRQITLACCVLHNLMRIRYPSQQNAALDKEDEDHNIVPGAWRQQAELHDLEDERGSNIDTIKAKNQRKVLTQYYNSIVGSVPWQEDMIH